MSETPFDPTTSALLDRAESLCHERGIRLTGLRRHVLGLVLGNKRPTGAYDLLEQLRPHHKGAAPPTIYRALDFLLEQGLVHKVESLSAFVGCVHGLDADHAHDPHTAQFLICKRCGGVTEMDDHDITQSLSRAAAKTGFVVSGAVIEVDGICGECAG